TTMVAISHVLWTTGLILPLPEIAAATHAAGATLLVDGAQSGGAIPLDMHETGADFYAASGQKWLLGPQGTGALWVHPRHHDRLRPATPSYFTYADGHVGPLREGAARFDPGSLDTTVLAGFAAAMEWVEGLPGGRDASADAVAHLAERNVLVRPIPDTPFVRVSVGAWTDDADIEALAAGLESL